MFSTHDEKTPLIAAVEAQNLDVVKLLAPISGLDPNARDTTKRTASEIAALQGLPEILDVVLGINGVNVTELEALKPKCKPEIIAVIDKHVK